MNLRIKMVFIFLLLMGVFTLTSQGYAAKPIAKVSSFKGHVVHLSGTEITKVTRIGQPLMEGDHIQTKDGLAQITFNDGALMKVRPYTSVKIEEREEKSGFWVFKTKKAVRRITCFVGKLWFKTGVSKRKNYLQTPTAVCGVRGTVLEIGYNNVVSLLNVITGLVDKVGPWKEGPFADPGSLPAFKNTVYQAVADAKKKMDDANKSKDPVDLAKAELAALNVVIVAAKMLESNPDEIVREEARKAADKARAMMQTIIDSYPEATTEPGPETTEPPPTTVEPITTMGIITTYPKITTTAVPPPTTTVPATTTTTSTTTTVPATTTTTSTTTTSTTTTVPETTTTETVTTTTVPVSPSK